MVSIEEKHKLLASKIITNSRQQQIVIVGVLVCFEQNNEESRGY